MKRTQDRKWLPGWWGHWNQGLPISLPPRAKSQLRAKGPGLPHRTSSPRRETLCVPLHCSGPERARPSLRPGLSTRAASLPPDNKSQRAEVLRSLQKMLGLMQFECAKCVTCIFQLISTSACTKLLFAFRPVSRGLSYIMGFSSSCNRRFHVLLITLHFH